MKRRRGITPWKKTALWFCLFFLLLAGALHLFRMWRSSRFEDQNEAARWGSAEAYAQVSAFLPSRNAMKQEEILQLEYEINTALAQDSIKVTSEREGARLWQDCYAGMGYLMITAQGKTVQTQAVGTGGEFFMFHPLILSSGSYYSSSSIMKDEILLDEQTAWRLFGAFNVVGRTVRVGDTNLRISGVFKKEEGSIYEEAGMPDCLVFVQYRTLVKYGTDSGSSDADDAAGSGSEAGAVGREGSGSSEVMAAVKAADPKTATAPSRNSPQQMPHTSQIQTTADPVPTGRLLLAAEDDAAIEEGAADKSEETGGLSGSDGDGFDDADYGSGSGSGGSGSGSGAGNGTGGTGTGAGTGSGTGSTGTGADMRENVGTGNTAYKDKGKITIYEIVMPDPVDGYAANKVRQALGEDVPAIVVDNTNRFGEMSLIKDLRDFALTGMRTSEIRLPYWENAARGYEAIFALLFLLECLLIGLTALLLIWMVIHYIRHKTWTLIGNLRAVENGIYERQSRKRYPEYYEDKHDDGSGTGEKGGRE